MNFDAKMAIYPSLPYQLSSSYRTGYCHPAEFESRTGISLAENDLIQQVYVWDEQTPGFWSNRPVEILDGKYFPEYLPLRDLLEGKEEQIIQITVLGKKLSFLCAQKESKNREENFEEFLSFPYYFAPPDREQNESFCTKEPFDLAKYRKLQERVPGNSSAVLQRIYTETIQKNPSYDNEALKRAFRKGPLLGSGGDGSVFRVADKKNGGSKALKISKFTAASREIVPITRAILNQKLSPHLTYVEKVFKVLSVAIPQWIAVSSPEDFVPEKSEGERELLCMGYLMEILDGDVESIYSTLSTTEKKAMEVQVASIHFLLESSFHTYVGDDKLRNIFFKKVEDDTTFRGKKLSAFDYWKYAIGEYEFYLPKMGFLIKLGDYDLWGSTLFGLFPDSQSSAERLLRARGIDPKEVQKQFSKPQDPHAKILDMTYTNFGSGI